LTGFQSRSDPGRLNVEDVFQVEPRERQHLQIFDRRGFLLDEIAQRGVLALVGPGDESRKAAGVFLNLANQIEVVHALLDGLAGAEHHGRRGADSQRVAGAVNIHPLLGRAFQAADAATDVIIQNFRAAAGDGIEARIAQARQGIAQGQAAHFGDIDDLRRREAMAPDIETLLDTAQQVFVPVDLQIRVQAALHQDAGAAEVDRLADLVEDHFLRVHVAFLMPRRAVKGAEAAIFGAEIRVIDIAIDDVADHALGVQLAAHLIAGHAEAHQVVAIEEIDRFGASHHAETPPETAVRSSAAAYFRYVSIAVECASENSKRMWRVRYSRTRGSAKPRTVVSWRMMSSM